MTRCAFYYSYAPIEGKRDHQCKKQGKHPDFFSGDHEADDRRYVKVWVCDEHKRK